MMRDQRNRTIMAIAAITTVMVGLAFAISPEHLAQAFKASHLLQDLVHDEGDLRHALHALSLSYFGILIILSVRTVRHASSGQTGLWKNLWIVGLALPSLFLLRNMIAGDSGLLQVALLISFSSILICLFMVREKA